MSTTRGRLTVVAIVLSSLGSIRPSAQPQPPTLAAASARMAANDVAGAVAILKAVTTSEPANGRAWRTLGAAEQQLKHYAEARAALQKALDVDPQMPAPLYSLGLVAALDGRDDEAFDWLSRARASKKIDMSQMENAPALARLKTDPRYAALRPTPADFAHPFVEEVTVLHEWRGESAGDQFGWIARNIGDVDGDHLPDVVTSAPSNNGGGPQAGRVYVYSTKTSTLLWKADGHAKDGLGSGVEAAGDTNHDGIPDVIASAPGGDYAVVYSGRDGRHLLELKAGAPGDQFGSHASGTGDVNGDGFADLIVGAPNNNAGGAQAGRAYVFSGKDGSVLLTLTGERAGDNFGNAVSGYAAEGHRFLVVGAGKAGPRKTGRVYVYAALQQEPLFTIESDEAGNALGAMFVSVLGDVDGDGTPDVYASDWSNGPNGSRRGRVYVHSGKDGHRLFSFSGQTDGEGFGTSPSPAGDVDGDGHADLIVGAWQYGGAALGAGRAYLYSGKDGHLVKTYTNKTPGDTFGFDAVTMGDVNGDGQDDFLITSGWSAVNGFHSGRVFVISSGVSKPTAMSQPVAAAQDSAARADAFFQKNDWQGAADAYRPIVKTDASNGMAWFRLGLSLEQLGLKDESLSAYQQAAKLGFQKMRAELGIARILASQGRAQDALAHLGEAASLGAPPAVIEGEPAFATLRSSAEYSAIKAKAEAARFPCRAVHTADFWVGDFDAKVWQQPDGPVMGQLHNTREYDGCVIVERWTSSGGAGGGMSIMFYDVNRKAWRMVWNDDTNSSSDFEGSYRDGALRFDGWSLDPSGNRILTSNVLQDVTPDLIRHIFSTSSDNGKTWVVRGDQRFVRRRLG